jgi:hypothetical protein
MLGLGMKCDFLGTNSEKQSLQKLTYDSTFSGNRIIYTEGLNSGGRQYFSKKCHFFTRKGDAKIKPFYFKGKYR